MTSWTWVPEPVAGQPFDRPFAFALVTLDGQVDGVRRALGHAYGGGSQFFAMWVVGAEPPGN